MVYPQWVEGQQHDATEFMEALFTQIDHEVLTTVVIASLYRNYYYKSDGGCGRELFLITCTQ